MMKAQLIHAKADLRFTLQNYNFSKNPQGDGHFFSFYGSASSHVMPTLACALAGIYGCGILESARLNMKTRHCISGCDRVVP